MLMCLGPVVFDLITNLDQVESEAEASFALHEVVHAAPVYEAMGDNETTFTLSGTIHPEHFGVKGDLAALEAARVAQIPLPLIRGDFVPLGWVVIRKLQRSDANLNPFGVGREISFTVSLSKVGSPAMGLASSILRLFQ